MLNVGTLKIWILLIILRQKLFVIRFRILIIWILVKNLYQVSVAASPLLTLQVNSSLGEVDEVDVEEEVVFDEWTGTYWKKDIWFWIEI